MMLDSVRIVRACLDTYSRSFEVNAPLLSVAGYDNVEVSEDRVGPVIGYFYTTRITYIASNDEARKSLENFTGQRTSPLTPAAMDARIPCT